MSEREAGKSLVRAGHPIQTDGAISPSDMTNGIAKLIGGLVDKDFDDVSATLVSESTSSGTKTRLDLRAYRHRKDGTT